MTEQHRQARRAQILEGAQACFAGKGYEAATIRDLEAAIGLSSGAILSYYPSKLDLFVAVAAQNAAWVADAWAHGGLRHVIAAQADRLGEAGSYLELGRRIWSDSDFVRKWQSRGQPIVDAVHDRLQHGQQNGTVRCDVALDDLVTYALATHDGLMLQLRMGFNAADLQPAVDLYEYAIAPPHRAAVSRKATRKAKTTSPMPRHSHP